MRKSEIKDHFDRSFVQLPLNCGDAVFFSPALLHAAGENRTSDIDRMGNLLQISSAFGKPMEKINRIKMSLFIYPFLLKFIQNNQNALPHIEAVVKATANGYSFPTDLDLIKPSGDHAPLTDQALMLHALKEQITPKEFERQLYQNQAISVDEPVSSTEK